MTGNEFFVGVVVVYYFAIWQGYKWRIRRKRKMRLLCRQLEREWLETHELP